MKKLILIISLLTFGFQINLAKAQCTPDSAIYAAGGYLFPAKIPFATAGVHYSQVLTFKIPHDSTVSGINVHIDSAQLLNIYGIPSGYGYQCNKPNCAWAGGTIGCALLSGVSDSTKIGSYTMYVYVKTWVEIGNTPPLTSSQRIDTSSYTFKVLSATGIFEVTPYQQLKVYPNPVNNILSIELNDVKTLHNTLEVFDATGRKVFAKEFSKPSVYTTTENVDLSNFPSGIYSVLLTTDAGVSVKKVVKN